MVFVKVLHKDVTRKFNISPNAGWIELEAKLRNLFHIPALAPFTLSYTDEDNDVITLSTDIELRDILSSAENVKFNLKFSTSDDSSDGEDSTNDEVWILEGGAPRAASIITNESDGSSLLDNSGSREKVLQLSTTNQEPQNLEIDSRDKNETLSLRNRIPILSDNDSEKEEEEEEEEEEESIKKTPKVNLLDDEFFESLDPPKLITTPKSEPEHIPQPQPQHVEPRREVDDSDLDEAEPEDESEDEAPRRVMNNPFLTFQEQNQNQPRRFPRTPTPPGVDLNRTPTPPGVDLNRFQEMIESYQDVILGNPQIIASVKDTMDQIQRSIPENYNQRRAAQNTQLQDRIRSSSASPVSRHAPPIPGSFPRHTTASVVSWAARNRESDDDNKHGLFYRRDRERITEREREETPETTDLEILYNDQVKTLKDMGYKYEDYAELLIKHDGKLENVLGVLIQ